MSAVGATDRLPTVTVVGLGPGGPDLVTGAALDALAAHEHRYLRTERHPAAVVVEGARSFDHVYEAGASMAEVYRGIVDELVSAAVEHGAVVYAVPGSPVVAETTVDLLRADDRIRCVIVPALSFLDLAWVRLGIDPVEIGVRLVDGHRFEVEAAGERGPLFVAQCDSVDVLSAVKLAIADALETRSTVAAGAGGEISEHDPEDLRITVVQRLGLPDELITEVRWDDLDREVEPDHLTSLYIPTCAAPVAREVQRFVELVATLRRECPWDREQTHTSLARHLLEESYEVLDALDHLDSDAGEGYEHLEEELGDLLFQIVFHSTLATESGHFTLADVARTVHDKLHGRHPHVFGDVAAADAEQVAANWEDLKKAEKGRASVFEGIPDALPALLYALKVQKKAAGLAKGSTAGVGRAGLAEVTALPSVADAVGRLEASADAEAVGSLLFAVVARAGAEGIDPETALRAVARAYRDEVRASEGTSAE